MRRGGIKVGVRTVNKTRDVDLHSGRVSRAILEETAKLGIKISQQSMKRAPKRKSAPRFDTPTVGTFKSGKRKGQTRRYVKRGKFSRPGQPPRYRSSNRGQSLKNQKFAYTSKDSLIFGPMFFKSFGNDNGDRVVPNIHEFGGLVRAQPSSRRAKKKDKRGPREGRLAASKKPKRNRVKKSAAPEVKVQLSVNKMYPSRPFVGPAGNKAFEIIMKGRGTRIARKIR